ncbi:hypothetical protein K8O92_33375 (plasmid) [Nocardia asteroides]|nr:hypothetical protein K8O92_33375 [Nocardia asteroides]
MGWNIEVVGVRTGEFAAAIPDVFVPTSTTMGFEDAISGARAPHLCAARVGDWVFVVDVACRLSGSVGYLVEASATTDLHLVRIADEPIAAHYRNGRQVREAQGRTACLELAPRDDRDGELCAMDLFAGSTGVDFRQDLWSAEFTLFELDL